MIFASSAAWWSLHKPSPLGTIGGCADPCQAGYARRRALVGVEAGKPRRSLGRHEGPKRGIFLGAGVAVLVASHISCAHPPRVLQEAAPEEEHGARPPARGR